MLIVHVYFQMQRAIGWLGVIVFTTRRDNRQTFDKRDNRNIHGKIWEKMEVDIYKEEEEVEKGDDWEEDGEEEKEEKVEGKEEERRS